MAVRQKIVAGDTWPPLTLTLADENGRVPLLGATVEFHMRPVPESGLLVPVLIGQCLIVAPSATQTDPNCGVVVYPWQAGDTAVPGVYEAEAQVTFGSGASETFPSDADDRQEVVIRAAVA